MKMAKSGHCCIQPDTPTPRRRAPPRLRHLRQGEPEARIFALSGPPRRSSAPSRRTSPPRLSIASSKRTC